MGDTTKTADDYLEVLRALLPAGPIWTFETPVGLGGLATAAAPELARCDAFMASVLDEASPCRTDACLDEWEQVAGLPDPCWAAVPGDTDDRKAALCAQVTMRVGAKPSDLEAHVLRTLGITITVTVNTRATFQADISQADDTLWDEWQTFLFEVEYPAALPAADLDRLECFVRRFKPAHCVAEFTAV